MPRAESRHIVVRPLEHGSDKSTNFGAVITGVDLNDLDDKSFAVLREAVYTHSVVVIEGQENLLPANQFGFVQRFDPDASPQHGFGYGKSTKELGKLGKKPFHVIPHSLGGVTLVGNGYQGPDHYGLREVTLDAVSHVDFHADPLPRERLGHGETRFNTFHFDGIIYGSHPSRVTTFRCVKAPKGPDVTVRFDDGTGRTIQCAPGSTAFISSSQLYDCLTAEEKATVDNSFWEPAPHPFAWSGTRGQRSTGLGVNPGRSGGNTVPLDQLPPWESHKVHKYPMVWINPVTGAKGLQLMPDIVLRLHLKHSPDPDGETRVVEDQEEIHAWLNPIYDRFFGPEYILIPPCQEGSMVVWNNWVGAGNRETGLRTVHEMDTLLIRIPY
ncbi:hypothetical protein A1O3_04886 [Capronia epimyces CBS 606.96]|uniref:TauD/TfdA-like domain-containing protein n=1 Tax=Capronia epimyces CBS 606.96 TaxID=1182542 RepID=W9YPM6_9EURO|nr:uncharacterized protein A1O3_04886 [Capronia epimyces CBS 606.96]EXJ84219.1 hypothetical protein A1O3_04886 [Capronia epimyces CBS 606.96]